MKTPLAEHANKINYGSKGKRIEKRNLTFGFDYLRGHIQTPKREELNIGEPMGYLSVEHCNISNKNNNTSVSETKD